MRRPSLLQLDLGEPARVGGHVLEVVRGELLI